MTTKIRPSTLENTTVSAGTYGGASQQAVYTVDSQGRLTYAANVTPSIATSQLTGTVSATQVANNQTYGINITGNASGSAGSVAWGNVSSRPTALSQFTNDLGNYGGWITGVSWTSVSGRPTALSSFTNDLGNYGNWITQNQVYSGSDAYYTNYPIGTTVLVLGGAFGGPWIYVNDTTGIFISESSAGTFLAGTAPPQSYYHQLSGTWRCRGNFNDVSSGTTNAYFIAQRVA
jgi:hypothetical protein